jgi:hypothetical protein
MIADGKPADVLNDYQRIVMERQEAYEASSGSSLSTTENSPEPMAPLHYTYRHGDGGAEILSAELRNSSGHRTEIVESGDSVYAQVHVRFMRPIDEPVIGFLIRNRHGIHAYGTNTREQDLSLGQIAEGRTLTIRFAFDCWLGVDNYSVSFAVHSFDGHAYDWVDGTLFFRVTSSRTTEGVANLNAVVKVVHEGTSSSSQFQHDEPSLTAPGA